MIFLIIKIPFLLFLSSLPVFVLAAVLLRLKIPGLSELVAHLGSAMLLSALALLIVTALLGMPGIIARSVLFYFSAGQRLQRRLLYIQAQQARITQLFHFKTLKIKYLNELHRKHLLKANNRKHIRSLSKAIHKDLLAIKKNLPKSTFRQLQQEHLRYRKQMDTEALLKLQQKIATVVLRS
ncbi:hypothetical protein [Methylobacter marinus]|uniref:hypothetical protein n=1 Tax=Methylobacter marinus TaxID=34058 RepID=UPI0012EC05D3